MTFRMLPPALPAAGLTTVVNGHSYSCSPGGSVDVPDGDVPGLEANGWIRTAGGLGTTAQRPTTGRYPRQRYLDTTLGYEIIWDGATRRSPIDGSAV